jgi:hypothetical protein
VLRRTPTRIQQSQVKINALISKYVCVRIRATSLVHCAGIAARIKTERPCHYFRTEHATDRSSSKRPFCAAAVRQTRTEKTRRRSTSTTIRAAQHWAHTYRSRQSTPYASASGRARPARLGIECACGSAACALPHIPHSAQRLRRRRIRSRASISPHSRNVASPSALRRWSRRRAVGCQTTTRLRRSRERQNRAAMEEGGGAEEPWTVVGEWDVAACRYSPA